LPPTLSKGFSVSDRRPAISKTAKEVVWQREAGVCQGCHEPIAPGFAVVNHAPPLWVRKRDETKPKSDPASYTPHANDPAYMTLLHNPQTTACKAHDKQTFGNGVYRGDVTEAARTKRILKKRAKEAAFRAQMLSNSESRPASRPKPKRQWPKGRKMQSRPFQKRVRVPQTTDTR
jgi:hypothetical protein